MTERVAPDGLIAVFAGTSEGRVLCERLSEAGRRAKAFVATEYGGELIDGLPGIDINVGRLDAAAMTEALVDAALVIDATHPYAAEASANVRSASRAAGVECVRLVRPSLLDPDGEDADQHDGVVASVVPDAAAAAAFLAGVEGDALLTTGSKDLPAYAHVPSLAQRCWPRVLPDADTVRRCHELGFPESQVICMQGPFEKDLNVALLRHCKARWLVTKDTGKAGGFSEKVEAVREAGARIVLIRRPVADEQGRSLDEVLALLGL